MSVSFDLMSDIHLDFMEGNIDFKFNSLFPESNSDYLLVCGDICTNICRPTNNIPKLFFNEATKHYKKVFVVLGNHDYWMPDGVIDETTPSFYTIPDYLKKNYGNDKVVFLENDGVEVDGVYLYGCTMWTDVPPYEQHMVGQRMNDYRFMFKDVGEYVNVQDTVSINHSSFEQLKKFVESHKDDKLVVMTHHAPSFMSCNKKYQGDYLNVAYANRFENFIINNNIKVWCHGHMHDSSDYVIGDTRVLCNPCGYLFDDRYHSWSGQRPYNAKTNKIANWYLESFEV